MDLTTGWDFSQHGDREAAWFYIQQHQPLVLIGSPMCTMFSKLQNLSKWTAEKAKRLKEAKEHLRFVAELYKLQVEQGRIFLHEHPKEATSW